MDESLTDLIWERADSKCEYCLLPQVYSNLVFEIDHVIARKHRGSTVDKNLCLACFACSRHKGSNIAGLDPRSGKLTKLFNPRRHKWSRHFRWEGAVLVGRTLVGRTTVDVLEINLPHRVTLP